MKIIVDDREQKVINDIKQVFGHAKVDRLEVGDYAFVNDDDNIVAIFERKTWSDLSSSIKDGRKDNIEKLTNLRTKTNCTIFYLIEGKYKAKRNLPKKSLQAHLDHLIFKDSVHVVYTLTTLDTANRLYELMHNIGTLKTDTKGGSKLLKEKNKEFDEKKNYCKVYKTFKGVGQSTANKLYLLKISLYDIYKDPTKFPKISFDTVNKVDLLNSIPYVTCGKDILAEFSFDDVMEGAQLVTSTLKPNKRVLENIKTFLREAPKL